MAGMEATWWLNDRLEQWLGERNVADTLTLSAPGNVTSEMGLALLDVADVVRRYPEVVASLAEARRRQLPAEAGAAEAGRRDRGAGRPGGVPRPVRGYPRRTGEIDITRPRVGRAAPHRRADAAGQTRDFGAGGGRPTVRTGAAEGGAQGAGGARPPPGPAGRRA